MVTEQVYLGARSGQPVLGSASRCATRAALEPWRRERVAWRPDGGALGGRTAGLGGGTDTHDGRALQGRAVRAEAVGGFGDYRGVLADVHEGAAEGQVGLQVGLVPEELSGCQMERLSSRLAVRWNGCPTSAQQRSSRPVGVSELAGRCKVSTGLVSSPHRMQTEAHTVRRHSAPSPSGTLPRWVGGAQEQDREWPADIERVAVSAGLGGDHGQARSSSGAHTDRTCVRHLAEA
jgi:hypothetical protein